MACRPEARGIPKVYHWFPLVFMVREDSHEMGAYPICKKGCTSHRWAFGFVIFGITHELNKSNSILGLTLI